MVRGRERVKRRCETEPGLIGVGRCNGSKGGDVRA